MNMKKIGGIAAAVLASVTFAACGSDDDGLDNGVDDSMTTMDMDTMTPDDTMIPNSIMPEESEADEGAAMDAANGVMSALMAMPDGGAPTIANFEAAGATLPAGIVLTGLDDDDEDGTDDDAKATVEANGGEDKACVQQQDDVWEVTDDEC